MKRLLTFFALLTLTTLSATAQQKLWYDKAATH